MRDGDIEMGTKYNNLADRTAADMATDYAVSAYRTIKSLHPEVRGLDIHIDEEEILGGPNIHTELQVFVPRQERRSCQA